jgi:hypothetical protein
LSDIKTKPNKTPADKALRKKAEAELQKALDAMKKSEQHAQKSQRPSRGN